MQRAQNSLNNLGGKKKKRPHLSKAYLKDTGTNQKELSMAKAERI